MTTEQIRATIKNSMIYHGKTNISGGELDHLTEVEVGELSRNSTD